MPDWWQLLNSLPERYGCEAALHVYPERCLGMLHWQRYKYICMLSYGSLDYDNPNHVKGFGGGDPATAVQAAAEWAAQAAVKWAEWHGGARGATQ
ncbi:MAG TPA: hypothetical protein VM537_03535 [Anaerolineae bacterium]|nr:hypothetical protein [Anaerolineae bacterium]